MAPSPPAVAPSLRRRREPCLAWALRVAAALSILLGSGGFLDGTSEGAPGWPLRPALCMPPPSDRTLAFWSTVIFNLGAAGAEPRWNARTVIPTLLDFTPIRAFAARRGLGIGPWLLEDGGLGPLEACQGRWRPAIAALAADPRAPGGVPSIAASVAAFNQYVRPLERAHRTRSKYLTHRRSVLTWAVWKGCLPQLLPMTDDMLRAFLWDCLAFEASVSVLQHAVDAVKGWHRRLGMRVPLDGPGEYRSLMNSLRRFQPVPRILKFPIHKFAVRRLLTVSLPPHPPCAGVKPPRPRGAWKRCPICWTFLHHWFNCLAAVTATLTCCRCLELGLLRTCDIWWSFDFLVGGWLRYADGAAYDIKVRKNDQFRHGHQARVGVPKDKRFDLLAQTREALRLLGTQPSPLCDGRFNRGASCPHCPPLFPRRIKKGTEFDLSRSATSQEVSSMIISALAHVGFNTAGFSGISARKGGLSTAIEAGVPEAILWMQSGHAQDVAARRYVNLNSPALLYRTYESFDL